MVDASLPSFAIAGYTIGGARCFIIAEAGVNHNGDVELARRLVDAAADAGADAVKFQTFSADRIATPEAPKAAYQKDATGSHESHLEMLRKLELSREAHRELQRYCRRRGILFLSSPFDAESADFLEELGAVAFKIPSGELPNRLLLEHIARKGRPMIVSTGMATLDEVDSAVGWIAGAGNREVALLHCVSSYPAAAEDVNLRAMRTLSEEMGLPAGYSDHTTGIDIALAAAALGACILEKHFTLDRTLPGPDQAASIEPAELRALVAGVRRIEVAMGTGRKVPASSEAAIASVARRSLVAACRIPAGARVTEDMVVLKRPGTGLGPAMMDQVVGRVARNSIDEGTLLSLDMLA